MFAKTNIKIERIFIGQYVKYSRALYQRTASHNERARKIEDSWEFGVLMLCFYCSFRFVSTQPVVWFFLLASKSDSLQLNYGNSISPKLAKAMCICITYKLYYTIQCIQILWTLLFSKQFSDADLCVFLVTPNADSDYFSIYFALNVPKCIAKSKMLNISFHNVSLWI